MVKIMIKNPKKRNRCWIVLIVVLIVISVLAFVGFVVIKSYLGQISRTYDQSISETILPKDEYFEVDETDENSDKTMEAETNENSDKTMEADSHSNLNDEGEGPDTSEEMIFLDPDDVEWNFIEQIEDDRLINILLVGQDRREGEGRQRSDTMILCSINPETGETSLISFLRDLYVQIPGGYSDNRLNATYVFGGFELLDATLAENFGVSIDGNFEADFTGFETIIDMVGGIDMELTSAEAAYMNKRNHSSVVTGLNHLNGAEALTYARARKIDSDFGRTERQRKVLLAVHEQTKDLSVSEFFNLLYNALPYLTTDLTDSEILSLAYRLLPVVSSISINSYTVPASDCYYSASIRGMSVLVPDLPRIRRYLEEYLPLE